MTPDDRVTPYGFRFGPMPGRSEPKPNWLVPRKVIEAAREYVEEMESGIGDYGPIIAALSERDAKDTPT